MKKYQVLSHYVVMETHIIELEDDVEPTEENVFDKCDEETRVRQKTRDFEVLQIEGV